MSWLQALILGVVQGLTEFLPVSSSGHLEIGQALLGTAGDDNLEFSIVVHTATVLSTIVVFRKQIWSLLVGVFSTLTWNKEKEYTAMLLLSMVPIFIVGVFFKDKVEQFFGNGLLLVGICLLLTATLLFLSEYLSKRRAEGKPVDYKSAFIIGCSQAVAVLPGLSRSGTTIATGLLCGVKKEEVAQFSFLMVMVPILGEALLESLKLVKGEAPAIDISTTALVVGFVAAFLTGCLACTAMIQVVKKQRLSWFALYCVIVGVFAIVYSQC